MSTHRHLDSVVAHGSVLARDLRVGYGSQGVLHGVDLRFAAGAISVVLGPGGSGKSTLLHALGGRPLGRPEPWMEGELRRPPAPPRWLPQRYVLAQGRSAAGPVRPPSLGGSLESLLAAEVPEEAPADLVRRVWSAATDAADLLAARLHEPLQGLEPSLGRLAELTLATCRGGLLLLDEPEVHLDEVQRGWLVQRLIALRGRATVVVATHHLGLARAVADHVLLLCDGRVVEAGDTPAFFVSPQKERTRRFIEMGA